MCSKAVNSAYLQLGKLHYCLKRQLEIFVTHTSIPSQRKKALVHTAETKSTLEIHGEIVVVKQTLIQWICISVQYLRALKILVTI